MEDTDYGQSAIMAFELMKNDGIPAREARLSLPTSKIVTRSKK